MTGTPDSLFGRLLHRLLLFSALLTCLFLGCAALSAAPKWWKAEASPFEVISNARKAEIQRGFETIWNARAGLKLVFPQLREDQEHPLLLVIAGNAKTRDRFSFRDGRRRKTLGGYFANDSDGYYTVINDLGSEEQTRETIVHEYVHHLMRRYSAAPLWIKEGFAEFFSTVQQTPKGQLVIGQPIKANVQYLRYVGLMPLEQLLAVGFDSIEYTGGQHTGTFYSQSWLLIHYLVLGEHELPKADVYAFIDDALNSRTTTEAHFQSHLGIGFAEMEKRLEKHLKSGRSYTIKLELEEDRRAPSLALNPVSEQESETLAARIMLDVRSSDKSREQIEAARHLWPDAADLLALEGEWLYKNDRIDEASTLFELSLERDDTQARAHLWYGIIQATKKLEDKFYQPGTLNKEETLNLLTHFFKAKQSGAGHLPRLYTWIGAVWLSSEVYPEDQHMAVLENALETSPESYGITNALALYYARCGRHEEAQTLINNALPLLHSLSREVLLADFSDIGSIEPIYKKD